MSDRDLILEVLYDLDRRVLQSERDGYPQGRQPEREQSAALRRLMDRVDAQLGWRDSDDPQLGVTHGPSVRCTTPRCLATIDMAIMGKKSKWFHGALGWLCPRHAP